MQEEKGRKNLRGVIRRPGMTKIIGNSMFLVFFVNEYTKNGRNRRDSQDRKEILQWVTDQKRT